ncbi:MAG: NAD(P)/FAD-dependent oxidoreductase [Acidobacteria bacterium]|nr:NAD(P)/FAD-dependent oxidoreductase [Acidobacteriota bacterium]
MKRIVILGAGFGGIEAAVESARQWRNRNDFEIVLVSENNYFMFTPLLPQIASSYINPRHIVQPVRDLRGRGNFEFRRDTVQSIDLDAGNVQLHSGTLSYDYLIVALGSRTDYFHTPGAEEFAWDYKSLQHAVELREHIIDLCEHADHTPDSAVRQRLLTFVVIGGGYTGVELITEMQDFLFGYVARHYRNIPAKEIRLVLLEAGTEILRGVHPNLANHSRRRLLSEGVVIRTGARVTRCIEGAVELNGSEMLPSETIVWAAGVRAHALVESLPGEHDRIGRAIVNPHLQMPEHPEVFIIGDSGAATTAADAPRVAPVAIDHGRIAARNIAHIERNQPLESYRYESKGITVSLGMNYAVVDVAGIRLSGYFAWLFWNALHLFKLVGFKKQIQVALDWMLGSIFPRDASIVRRPKACKFCEAVKDK